MTDGLGHLPGRPGQTSTPLAARRPPSRSRRPAALTSRPLRRVARIIYFRSLTGLQRRGVVLIRGEAGRVLSGVR